MNRQNELELWLLDHEVGCGRSLEIESATVDRWLHVVKTRVRKRTWVRCMNRTADRVDHVLGRIEVLADRQLTDLRGVGPRTLWR